MKSAKKTWYCPFKLSIICFALFIPFALVANTPSEIAAGFVRIIQSQSLLVTDYIAVGNIGATLVNAALTGTGTALLLILAKIPPNGALVMAVWLTTGFSFFGKNLFNVIPITVGVWLYSKWQKEPFSQYSLVAILASTLAPVVSEITFLDAFPIYIELLIGFAAGIAAGFITPVIAAYTTKIHAGYNLYNVGFAGGIIALFITAILKGMGVEIKPQVHWSTGNNLFLAIFLYFIMAIWLLWGLLSPKRKEAMSDCKKIIHHSGRLVSDYFLLYGDSVFFNMAVMGIFATTLTLLIGAELNGASLAGIFTIMGFGAFGKHLRNSVPIMVGALIAALLNPAPYVDPRNITAILFSTALAPLAGQYGPIWGALAGALHVTIVYHVSSVTGGLNLYNNGFSAGFVVVFLLPVITAFTQRSKENEQSF